MADPTSALLNQEASAIAALNYSPLNLTQLQQQAEQDAAQNVSDSLALQQQFQPGVAASNSSVQSLIAQNIANPGSIPPDVMAQVQREAGGQAGASGLLGSNAPYTAATLGNTALNLTNQRIAQSEQLSAQNPQPVSGLDPGALASASIANTNASNQFALSKLNAQGNLTNSRIGAYGAQQMAGNSGVSTGFGLPSAPVGNFPQLDPNTGLPVAPGYNGQSDASNLYNSSAGQNYAGGNLNGISGTPAYAGGFGMDQTDQDANDDASSGVGSVGDF